MTAFRIMHRAPAHPVARLFAGSATETIDNHDPDGDSNGLSIELLRP